jgi:hypothetical protein
MLATMEGTPPRHPRPRRALMVRAFGAGARGARRVADATGIEEVVEQTTEDAIVAALESEAVERALLRVLEGPALVEALERAGASSRLERTVVEALDSELVDRVWERMLASDEAQKLVERIAEAPEVRAAVSQQGIGLLEDIGRQIRDLADRFDDVLEGLAHRLTRRHRRPEAADAKKRVGLVTRARGRDRRRDPDRRLHRDLGDRRGHDLRGDRRRRALRRLGAGRLGALGDGEPDLSLLLLGTRWADARDAFSGN